MKQMKKVGKYFPILLLSMMSSVTYARCVVVPNGQIETGPDLGVVETMIFQNWGDGESTAYPVETPEMRVQCDRGTSAQLSLAVGSTSLDPWYQALGTRRAEINILHEYNARGNNEDTGEFMNTWGRTILDLPNDNLYGRQNPTSERLDGAEFVIQIKADPRYLVSDGWLLRPPPPLTYRFVRVSYWPTGQAVAPGPEGPGNVRFIYGDNRLVLQQRLDPCNTNNMTVTVSPQIINFGTVPVRQGDIEVRRPFSITYQQNAGTACQESIVGNIRFVPNGTYNGTAMRLSNGFDLSLVKSPNDTPVTYGMPSRVQAIPPRVGNSMPTPVREEYVAVLKKDANTQSVEGPFNGSIRYIFEIL
ncbi:hypothetical protein [Ignatzschineria sp. LJL83]